MNTRKPKPKCAYCGFRDGTNRDHVPPKSLFLKPLPIDLVTVPCCHICNNGFSKLDEEFRFYLSVMEGADSPASSAFWSKHALPTARQNRRLLRQVLHDSYRANITTPTGLSIGDQLVTRIPTRLVNQSIERMARGLYNDEFKEVLGNSVNFSVTISGENDHALRHLVTTLMPHCQYRSVGGAQFEYWIGRTADNPLGAVFFFRFRSAILMAALCAPVEMRAAS